MEGWHSKRLTLDVVLVISNGKLQFAKLREFYEWECSHTLIRGTPVGQFRAERRKTRRGKK
jgi:hypothetical protein